MALYLVRNIQVADNNWFEYEVPLSMYLSDEVAHLIVKQTALYQEKLTFEFEQIDEDLWDMLACYALKEDNSKIVADADLHYRIRDLRREFNDSCILKCLAVPQDTCIVNIEYNYGEYTKQVIFDRLFNHLEIDYICY